MKINLRPYYMPMVRWGQRRWRGWDDSDTWSLDYTMARLMYPRFKRFRQLDAKYNGGSSAFLPKGLDFNDDAAMEGAWEAARLKQTTVYDDIEYFLDAVANERDYSDGYLFTDEIEDHVERQVLDDEGNVVKKTKHSVHKRVRDERYFRGQRYLVKYIHTMWW